MLLSWGMVLFGNGLHLKLFWTPFVQLRVCRSAWTSQLSCTIIFLSQNFSVSLDPFPTECLPLLKVLLTWVISLNHTATKLETGSGWLKDLRIRSVTGPTSCYHWGVGWYWFNLYSVAFLSIGWVWLLSRRLS